MGEIRDNVDRVSLVVIKELECSSYSSCLNVVENLDEDDYYQVYYIDDDDVDDDDYDH